MDIDADHTIEISLVQGDLENGCSTKDDNMLLSGSSCVSICDIKGAVLHVSVDKRIFEVAVAAGREFRKTELVWQSLNPFGRLLANLIFELSIRYDASLILVAGLECHFHCRAKQIAIFEMCCIVAVMAMETTIDF